MGGLHLRLAEQHDEPVPAGVRRRASAAARHQQSRERSGKRARPGGAAAVEPVGQVDHEVRREAMAAADHRAQSRPGPPPALRGDMPRAPSAGETLAKASPQNWNSLPTACYNVSPAVS